MCASAKFGSDASRISTLNSASGGGSECCFAHHQPCKGLPFEVAIPDGLRVIGVILADQLKSLDWRTRKADFIATLSADTVELVIEKALLLLTED